MVFLGLGMVSKHEYFCISLDVSPAGSPLFEHFGFYSDSNVQAVKYMPPKMERKPPELLHLHLNSIRKLNLPPIQ
jgi:hypothetical protein